MSEPVTLAAAPARAPVRTPEQAPAVGYHSGVWLIWVTGVLIVLTTGRNPWYIAATLLAISVVTVQVGGNAEGQNRPAVIDPLRFGLFAVVMGVLFNGLTVRVGETVLFAVPSWLPLLGGPVTLEALVFGALNGLVLAGLFAAFSVLNRMLPIRSLIRMIPRAFYPVAVVMAIAVTYIPSTVTQIGQVREAQAVRGNRMQGLRSWLPLFLPLLVGGIERSLQLAEAMTARGFAAGENADSRQPRAWGVAGLAAIVTGWLLQLVWRQPLWGGVLLLAGGLLLLAALRRAGRAHRHTVYRPERWRWVDLPPLAGVAVAVAVMIVPLPWVDRMALMYYPYPLLTWPTVDWTVMIGLCGLALPAIKPAD